MKKKLPQSPIKSRRKSKPAKTSAQKVFETEWFSIDAVPFNPSVGMEGRGKPYYRLTSGDSVAMLTVTEDKKLVFVRQYRPAVETHILELPAGQIDPGETLEEAMKRELLEETGYVCENITYFGPYKVDPCRINSTVHVFLGRGARFAKGRKTEKDIDAVLFTFKEFEEQMAQGKFKTFSALAFYSLAKLKGLL